MCSQSVVTALSLFLYLTPSCQLYTLPSDLYSRCCLSSVSRSGSQSFPSLHSLFLYQIPFLRQSSASVSLSFASEESRLSHTKSVLSQFITQTKLLRLQTSNNITKRITRFNFKLMKPPQCKIFPLTPFFCVLCAFISPHHLY